MNFTDTELATLKHILKFGNNTIDIFDKMNLDSNERAFLIFNMMVKSFENGRKLGREENTKKKRKLWIK